MILVKLKYTVFPLWFMLCPPDLPDKEAGIDKNSLSFTLLNQLTHLIFSLVMYTPTFSLIPRLTYHPHYVNVSPIQYLFFLNACVF